MVCPRKRTTLPILILHQGTGVSTMEWEPSEALVAWGNEHFGKMPVGSIWAPDDSGVQYQKLGETSYVLIFLLDGPLAQEHHEKFTILMKACGYVLLD